MTAVEDLRPPRDQSAPAQEGWKLGAKLGAIGAVLLLLALASIALTLSVTWKLEGGAAAVNEAGRMRMQTWRLAQALPNADAPVIQGLVHEFDRSVALLRSGDPSRPLFVPHDDRSVAAFADVQQSWLRLRTRWQQAPLPLAGELSRDAAALVEQIDAFVSAIEGQLSRLTALLNLFQLAMLALALAAAVTLLYAAYLFVFDPLARLQQGLARLEGGDLSTRVAVASRDELGALSAAFNRMATTLQGLYQSLEARVAEKTAHLQTQHERLAALYDATSLAARATTLDELARGFAKQLRRVAHADASAVRWSDENNQRYVLLASDCLPQQLIDAEACLAPGDCHCGQSQASAQTQVIPIRVAAAGLRQNCARHGFEGVISVPVRLHERLVGEIDLFFRHAATLSAEDRSLLEALASHLAGAMETLRIGALEREAAVAAERTLLANELHDSIAQSLAFLKIQVKMLRDAIGRHDAVATQRIIEELDAGVRESTGDVRELLVHFRTRTNAEDITPALQATLQKFEHQTGLSTQLSVSGQGLPLPPDVQVQVLHVVQEALSNVRKHAAATQVWVEVQQAPPWHVKVRDNGSGFADASARSQNHVGLHIMRERATRIGARVTVDSAPGAGTCVELAFPEAALS